MIHETDPKTVELTEENGEQVEYEKREEVYISGEEQPRYVVGTDRIHTTDNYVCIRLGNQKGPGSEVHKIPHERIRVRKRTVLRATTEIDASEVAE